MGAFGTFNSNRDPMRNAALSAQFENNELSRDKKPVSGARRKAAYIAMFLLAAFLIGMIVLFFVL